MEDRLFQTEACIAINKEWKAVDRTLLVQATGTGKTIIFCRIAGEQVTIGRRVLILAHRGELLEQAADKMRFSTGLRCAVEKAEMSCLEPPECFFRIVIGSIQSMQREDRLNRFRKDYFDVIIVDEAHHALSDSYQRVLNYFPKAKVLGVTATPDRGDMKNLGEYFESLAYEYTLPRAVKEGYLCKIKAMTVPLRLDITGVSTQAGDFKTNDLGTALDPYLEQISKEIVTHCKDRKTIVFLPLIATSEKMCDFLIQDGLKAVEINGKSENRKEILADFEAGVYDILCNSMLLTEGYDCPSVDCIICLRPTKNRSLYVQIIGRGTRIHPGKDHLLILDFLWHTDKHELCRPAHLIASNDEVAKAMVEICNEERPGDCLDLQGVEEVAESNCIEERENSLADKLSKLKRRKQKLVDPLQFEMSIQSEDLASYVPAFGWEMAQPSDKQKTALEKMGISPDTIECAGKASKILDRLSKRRASGLATPKQINRLEIYGFQHVGQWEFESCKKLINRIAANRWRVPYDIKPKTYKPEGVS